MRQQTRCIVKEAKMSKNIIRTKYQLFNGDNKSEFESTISIFLQAIDRTLFKNDFGNLLLLSHLTFIIIEYILKSIKQHENEYPLQTHKIYELYKDLEPVNQNIINQNMHLLSDKYKLYYRHVQELLKEYNHVYDYIRYDVFHNPNQMHLYTRNLLFLADILIRSIRSNIDTNVFEKIYEKL